MVEPIMQPDKILQPTPTVETVGYAKNKKHPIFTN
jgi:hypothetical protein